MMPFTHDPQAKLDYSVDWSAWLAEGETITASSWTVADGLTEATPAPSHTDTQATIWLTGGTTGEHYRVTNHITTNQSRQDDRTITVMVEDR